MIMGMKKILFVAFVAIATSAFMSGCSKKVDVGGCKTNDDCRVDASGATINGICYMGKCEECLADTDCTDLKQCVDYQCLAACQSDGDCGQGKHCANSFCRNDCLSDSNCPTGDTCSQGRCLSSNEFGSDCHALAPVRFDFDRYDIKSEYEHNLEASAQCLEKNPTAKLTISGHTDEKGTSSYNQVLAQKRADAARTWLRDKKGIASNRVKTISFGEKKPVNTESNEYAWEQNRRTEFEITDN